jgi:tRNA modification GTPase
MQVTERPTIFALSSGRPPAAIAVIRISGPRSGAALKAMTGRLPQPRQATLARICRPGTPDIVDEALVLWFPAPRSETGEDVVELQLHGGRAVVAAVLSALAQIEGCRPAEAGEFTRRAFENGRIDLTAVEGLADLVAAETEAQRRQALRQLQGALRERVESWRIRLIDALALVEAGIDFADEGDVPPQLLPRALRLTRPVADEIGQTIATSDRGERLREGYRVAIAGPPNAGKSSLLNLLAHRDAAIVSPIPGTTRDVIEVHLDLGGYPVTLLDTAGIRDSVDPIEREGVDRARRSVAAADLVMWIVDGESDGAFAEAVSLSKSCASGQQGCVVVNKMDLLTADRKRIVELEFNSLSMVHFVSVAVREGIDDLVGWVRGACESFFAGEPALVTRQRQLLALRDTLSALDSAHAHPESADEALVAEDLRLALRGLGRLTGQVDVEEILDVIFRDFCIGK